ncbi:MAG: hypothetical protein LUE10_00040 [Alistipes sp.]|nr:hypothetical protein [Alistipes sp.]
MANIPDELIEQFAELLEVIGNGKRIDELPDATGTFDKMYVPVRDSNGETAKLNLRDLVDDAGNPIAGRYWDETNSTPTAAGYFGSLEALKALPTKLGLGRYLVTDDRIRRKLDPRDSTKFEDGTTALLDGTMGQCMWCWNAHYYTTWMEGNYTIEAITFAPVKNRDSVYIPAGGKSWFDAGVLDSTTGVLCSVISDDERYRGGGGSEISVVNYPLLPASSPQRTMLSMPRTAFSSINFGAAARKRGTGWEANWYIAQAATEYIPRIILGTRNIQEAFNSKLDINGLIQGGLGEGMTDWDDADLEDGTPRWRSYNGLYPLLPTSFGIEVGDGTTVLPYSIYTADGGILHTFQVPIFFGYVNPNYGNLYNFVRGILYDHTEEAPSRVYIAPSMFPGWDGSEITDDMLYVGDALRNSGYIKRLSMHLMASLPVEIGGTSGTYFCDYYATSVESGSSTGLRVRLSSGRPASGTSAGAVTCYTSYSPTNASATMTAPLCYFETDPSPIPVRE